MNALNLAHEPDETELALFLPELETARLRLRRPRLEDGPAIFAGYATDPEVTRFLLWRPHERLDETFLFLAAVDHAWRENAGHRPWVLADKASGELLGMIGIDYGGHSITIGYVLRRSHWGRGIISEAATFLTDHALSLRDCAPPLRRVEAICHVDNPASARVLEKAGFLREGLMRRHTVFPAFGPVAQDVFLYARTVD